MAYKGSFKKTSNSSSRGSYGHNSKPTHICLHHWGRKGQKFWNVVGWLRGRAGGTSNRGSSAHYVVQDGVVCQLENESRATWHAGNRKGNGQAIGIEMRPEMTQGDWNTLVELCVDIERRRGSMKYIRHMDYKATACPGLYKSQLKKLVRDVNRAKKGKPVNPPKSPTPSKTPAHAKQVWPKGALPVTSQHTAASHKAWVQLLSGVGFKDKNLTLNVQRWLQSLGYYKGYNLDGKFETATVKGLQGFLKSKGLYKGRIDGKRQALTVQAEIRYLNLQRKYYK